MKAKINLLVLPRWFAAPTALAAILLGVALTGAWSWLVPFALLAGLFLMAYAHSYNSFADFAITGFDKGPSHSAEKLYTSGSAVIRLGLASPRAVALNSLGWLVLAVLLTVPLSIYATPWVWVPFGLVVLCAPWYSWGKKLWHPEAPLGFGFSTCAVWLGMSVSGSIGWWTGFLASIPLFLLFGVMAEHVDQYSDYASDWPKGGRSLGLLTAHLGISLWQPVLLFTSLTYLTQIILVNYGILSTWTYLTFAAAPVFALFLGFIGPRFKVGVACGLAGIFVYDAALVVGQVVGG